MSAGACYKKNMVTPTKRRGFTLIELLVVIAIIGILSATVLVSLNTARGKARDARRQSDLKSIATALELYYFDNGRYPAEAACDSSRGTKSQDCTGLTGDNWSPTSYIWAGLVPKYIPQLPIDPLNNESHYYRYEPHDATKNYCLGVALERGGSFYIENIETANSC